MTSAENPAPEGASDLIETDYEIGQDNIQPQIGPFGLDIHNPVFAISGLTVVAFVILTLAFQTQTEAWFSALRGTLTSSLDWFFLIAANVFVVLCIVLIFTPLGKVRLGGVDAKPEYSYLGWFAMLFAAGMGIGLMFFGVLEPVYHMAISQPLGVPAPFDVEGNLIPENVAAAREMGMAATIFHWGPSPLGNLCGGGARPGAVRLQQGPAADHPLDVLPDLRGPDLGAGRVTSSTCWRSSPPCSASPPRWASARRRPMPGWATSSGSRAMS